MHAHNLDRAAFAAGPAHQGIAMVLECREQGWLLDAVQLSAPVLAGRAASCLIEPQVGDRVWFVGEGDEQYILAVLERQAASDATVLQVEGDLELRAGGRVRLDARDIELEADSALALRGDELSVEARRGRVLLDALSTFIRTVHANLSKSTFVGKALELLFERVVQHSNTSYRSVAEVDHVRAGTIDYRAEGVAHVHAENTSMSAAELVKVDAGQIHLG